MLFPPPTKMLLPSLRNYYSNVITSLTSALFTLFTLLSMIKLIYKKKFEWSDLKEGGCGRGLDPQILLKKTSDHEKIKEQYYFV